MKTCNLVFELSEYWGNLYPNYADDTVLTSDMILKASEFNESFPTKMYFPISTLMWDSIIGQGWTEEQLTNYGFLKTEYIELAETEDAKEITRQTGEASGEERFEG